MAPVTRFVQGSTWMIAMRWAIRSAGLVSTMILARVLTPADFGIVAMSSLVYGLLLICSEMGVAQLLLRTGETRRQAYDTAWTITLIQSVLLGLLMFAASWPAAAFFSEPRLVAVMQVVAAGSLFTGLTNIGVVMFRRDLDFRRDFLYGFCAKVLTVIPTVILALTYRSYWALIAGQIIGDALEAAISYLMHPFRPRLCLTEWRRFVMFSLWVTPANIATFLSRKTDVFVVGYLATTAQMGVYNVASELSRMATAEIVTPMARAIYPSYAKLRNDIAELTSAFLIVVRTVCIITFSFGFGLAAVAEDAVYVLFGSQWGSAAPLIAWLGIFGAFTALLASMTGHIMVVLGRERTMFFINWLKLAVFAASVLLAARLGGITDIAMAAALSTAAFTIGCVFYLPSILPVSAGRILLEILRVLVAALAMVAAVKLLHAPGIESRLVRLLLDATVGATVFVSIIGLSWIAVGRPDGPEKRVLRLIAARLRRSRP